MLIKPNQEQPLNLPQSLETTIAKFKNLLTADEGWSPKKNKKTPTSLLIHHLHEVLMGCWMEAWHPSDDNLLPCPTSNFVMRWALRPDGGFKQASEISSLLSQVQWAIRLAFLFQIDKQAREVGDTQRNVSIQLQRWFIEKELPSAFHHVRSTQHIVTTIAHSDHREGNIEWVDEKDFRNLKWHGDEIQLDKVIDILHDLETEVVKILEKDLFFGLKVTIDLVSLSKLICLFKYIILKMFLDCPYF